MKHRNTLRWKYGVLIFLGMSLIGLVVPLPARAGGVHVSIGFELPVPVVVFPAPVFVAPAPVIVQRAPVIIEQPAPVIVQQEPVVIEEQRVVYPGYLPPGLAKKFYGYQHVHGDGYYKHWKHHHDDD